MAEKFKNFYIDHVPRQQNAHADALTSLAASLALSVRATERVLVYSRDLYCCKFTLKDNITPREDLKVKEVLETLTNLGTGDSLTLTLSCTVYCLSTLRRQLSSEGKLLDTITM